MAAVPGVARRFLGQVTDRESERHPQRRWSRWCDRGSVAVNSVLIVRGLMTGRSVYKGSPRGIAAIRTGPHRLAGHGARAPVKRACTPLFGGLFGCFQRERHDAVISHGIAEEAPAGRRRDDVLSAVLPRS